MNLANTALVNTALVNTATVLGSLESVSSNVQTLVLKKATSLHAEDVAELLTSVAQPAAPTLAGSGSLGTQLNT